MEKGRNQAGRQIRLVGRSGLPPYGYAVCIRPVDVRQRIESQGHMAVSGSRYFEQEVLAGFVRFQRGAVPALEVKGFHLGTFLHDSVHDIRVPGSPGFALLTVGPRPVLETAEPFIERDGAFTVVTIEVTVVQVVKVRAEANLIAQFAFKPRMPGRRGQRGVLGIEQKMNGVRGNDPVNQRDAEIEHVFDRMHRHAGPRAGVDIVMVQVMNAVVQRLPVDQTVDPVKMKLPPEGNQEQDNDEGRRRCLEIDVGQSMICVHPHRDHLISGPGDTAAAAGPEDIVVNLVLEEEGRAAPALPAGRVFSPVAPAFPRIQIKVPAPVNDPEQRQIAQEHPADPTRLKRPAGFQARLEVRPRQQSDAEPEDIPGEQIIQEPAEKPQSLPRPHEDRGKRHALRGTPFPALVPVPVWIAGLLAIEFRTHGGIIGHALNSPHSDFSQPSLITGHVRCRARHADRKPLFR